MRRFRAWLTWRLILLAYRLAPTLDADELIEQVQRVTRPDPAFSHQGRLRVHRPDGLSTTHGPIAPNGG
jgi:hypothetical protein